MSELTDRRMATQTEGRGGDFGPPSAQIERHTDRQKSIWTDRQMDKDADTQKKQTDRHAEGWTDKSLVINGETEERLGGRKLSQIRPPGTSLFN